MELLRKNDDPCAPLSNLPLYVSVSHCIGQSQALTIVEICLKPEAVKQVEVLYCLKPRIELSMLCHKYGLCYYHGWIVI